MFQTEPIKFLQSFASDWLTDFFLFITQLGYSSFYIPVLILVTLGLSFRKGFLLIQMLIWVAIVTDLLKTAIALPRPADVDSGVLLLKDNVPNPTPFTGKGGGTFWSLPDAETVRIIRAQPEWSFGLPSGHVSGTTTFWGGLSMLFPWAALRSVAIAMIILMPLSRMYLGRHFLADALAGLLLGAAFLALAYVGFVRPGTEGRLLGLSRLRLTLDLRGLLPLILLLLVPLFLLLLGPMVGAEHVGRLLGLNAAFVVIALGGLPDDAGSWLSRAGRVVLTFALYLAVSWLVGRGLERSGLNEDSLGVEFLAAAIPAFASFWGGVRLSLATGLYRRTESTAAAT